MRLEMQKDQAAAALALASHGREFHEPPLRSAPRASSAVDIRFDLDLIDSLPRLHIYALSLTRNGDRANDLVQQTVLKALAGRDSFRTGTNFSGWMFRIQRNEFISELRRNRPTVDFDSMVEHTFSDPPQQEDGLMLHDLLAAFRQLPNSARQAILLSRFEGRSHQQIAAQFGIAEGTVKSRVSRGRATLARLLELQAQLGSPGDPASPENSTRLVR